MSSAVYDVLVDVVYHACLDKWDEVKKGLDVEDQAAILIDVVALLNDKIQRDEEYECRKNVSNP
jgi:hypothetical protein